MNAYPIVEIFESLQGEGYNVGMPAVFLRFGGCNLACKWCDTDFQTYHPLSLDAIIQKVQTYKTKNIIITGGEPTLQTDLALLLQRLKENNYYIAIETNGLKKVEPLIDYIAISPKFAYRNKYRHSPQLTADEVRIVVEEDDQFYAFCVLMNDKISAKNYFLSPCEVDGKFNMLTTLSLLGSLNRERRDNKWLLSLQAHKLANIE